MRPLGQWPSQPASSWLRYCSAYDLDGVRQALERPWSLPTPSAPAELPQVPARVLVVDDNPLNRQVLREQLARLGCQALIADSGAQALALAARHRPDVVLTDINMPEIDGYTLAQQLRQQGFQQPIYGVTALLLERHRTSVPHPSITALLARPLSIPQLARLLADALRAQS